MASSTNMDVSGSANKRARYSGSRSTNRQKIKSSVPYLGFESDQQPQLAVRSTVNVDSRFLPYGISPGMILEIKGPEKSGKTFLLTYFIARMLTKYPEKKAVLINTRHKFTVKNFLSLLPAFDAELKNAQLDLSLPIDTLISTCPKVGAYLDRVLVIPCYSAEDLMLTLGPAGESVLQTLLLNDDSISLVAVDAIDTYSFAESLQAGWVDQWTSIMESLKSSVSQSKCPVICTTLISANKHEYRKKTIPRKQTPSSSGDAQQSTSGLPLNRQANVNSPANQEENIESNFSIDYSIFTTILEIVLASKAQRARNVHLSANKANHYAYAYLCSKQSANTAGSGGNHRARFSIFSDMLWVMES